MAGMEFILTGEEDAFEVEGMLQGGALQAGRTRVVMDRIVADMLRVEKVTFRAQGRRGGGSWAALAPDTIRKKGIGGSNILRTDLANEGYSKIGNETSSDTLFKSVTVRDAPYQILKISRNSIAFGTSRPYAGAHQTGSWLRHIPARPFLVFIPEDYTRWENMIADFMMEPMDKPSNKK